MAEISAPASSVIVVSLFPNYCNVLLKQYIVFFIFGETGRKTSPGPGNRVPLVTANRISGDLRRKGTMSSSCRTAEVISLFLASVILLPDLVFWHDSAKCTYCSDGSLDLRGHTPKKAVEVKFQHLY